MSRKRKIKFKESKDPIDTNVQELYQRGLIGDDELMALTILAIGGFDFTIKVHSDCSANQLVVSLEKMA